MTLKEKKNAQAQDPTITDADLAALTQAAEEAAGAVMMTPEETMILEAANSVDTADNETGSDQKQDSSTDSAQDSAQDADQKSFKELYDAVTESQAHTESLLLAAAFAERAKYEHEKDAGNTNIQKTISKIIPRLSTPGVVRAQVVIGTGAKFVNVSETKNNRRNVYALQKVADLLYGAVTGHLRNSINRAVLGSMVALKDKAGAPFTGQAAKACASDKVAIESSYKAFLVRHTVAESTASTQASSTMTALEDLGVVTNNGTRAHPVYSFTDSPLARRLQEIGSAIAHGSA